MKDIQSRLTAVWSRLTGQRASACGLASASAVEAASPSSPIDAREAAARALMADLGVAWEDEKDQKHDGDVRKATPRFGSPLILPNGQPVVTLTAPTSSSASSSSVTALAPASSAAVVAIASASSTPSAPPAWAAPSPTASQSAASQATFARVLLDQGAVQAPARAYFSATLWAGLQGLPGSTDTALAHNIEDLFAFLCLQRVANQFKKNFAWDGGVGIPTRLALQGVYHSLLRLLDHMAHTLWNRLGAATQAVVDDAKNGIAIASLVSSLTPAMPVGYPPLPSNISGFDYATTATYALPITVSPCSPRLWVWSGARGLGGMLQNDLLKLVRAQKEAKEQAYHAAVDVFKVAGDLPQAICVDQVEGCFVAVATLTGIRECVSFCCFFLLFIV